MLQQRKNIDERDAQQQEMFEALLATEQRSDLSLTLTSTLTLITLTVTSPQPQPNFPPHPHPNLNLSPHCNPEPPNRYLPMTLTITQP